MDETLNPVNDGQAEVVAPQDQPTEQPVNAGDAEVTTGGQEQVDTPAAAEPTGQKAQSKEENAQFAKVRREAEARVKAEYEARQAARDAEFARKARDFGWVDSSGAPITTEAGFIREMDYRSKVDALLNQGADPEAARLKVENDALREEREAEKRAREDYERRQAENQAFFDFFREANGREFSSSDEIPDEVFRAAEENGIPLKYAYAEHLAKIAREKERSLGLGKQTSEINAKNAQTTTGSVTGAPLTGEITESEIAAHANDTAWMMKNYAKVEDFYRKKG